MADEVLYSQRGRVALITLNRPQYANAQNLGIPGVEYFAHPWMLGPRLAKEVLFTGGRFGAERAYQAGMVSRVVPRADLETAAFDLAGQIEQMPRFGLALAKRAVNQCEDLMGLRPGMDSAIVLALGDRE